MKKTLLSVFIGMFLVQAAIYGQSAVKYGSQSMNSDQRLFDMLSDISKQDIDSITKEKIQAMAGKTKSQLLVDKLIIEMLLQNTQEFASKQKINEYFFNRGSTVAGQYIWLVTRSMSGTPVNRWGIFERRMTEVLVGLKQADAFVDGVKSQDAEGYGWKWKL